jgi:hypothetical protein
MKKNNGFLNKNYGIICVQTFTLAATDSFMSETPNHSFRVVFSFLGLGLVLDSVFLDFI